MHEGTRLIVDVFRISEDFIGLWYILASLLKLAIKHLFCCAFIFFREVWRNSVEIFRLCNAALTYFRFILVGDCTWTYWFGPVEINHVCRVYVACLTYDYTCAGHGPHSSTSLAGGHWPDIADIMRPHPENSIIWDAAHHCDSGEGDC